MSYHLTHSFITPRPLLKVHTAIYGHIPLQNSVGWVGGWEGERVATTLHPDMTPSRSVALETQGSKVQGSHKQKVARDPVTHTTLHHHTISDH